VDRGAGVRLRRGLGTRDRRREARAELVVRGAEFGEGVLEHARRVVRAHHALRRQPRTIRLAHRHLLLDALRLERLRVRRLVLLVVAEAAIADEIHDDVVPELLAIRESKSDRGQRGLGIVRVDVHDRNVEALREVARIPRRTAFSGIRGEADLVVRDQMQRPTGRVPVEAVQIEGLGHDALAGERRVTVDEHRERHGRIVDPRPAGAIGLLGARKALDHGVDRFQMAGVGRDGDLDLAGVRHARLRRREVVLDVTRAALRVRDQRIDRPLPFELAKDRGVRPADDMGQDVQAAAMGDADQHLVRAATRGQLDGIVEHRHEHVQPFDRELLLTDERAPEVGLEGLDLREALQKRTSLLVGQRSAKATRLDRLAQPDALGVVRDVLDLVRDRACVDLAQVRERLEESLAGHREPQQLGRNPSL